MKINQRQMERAMKRMGIQSHEIEAEEVVIKTADKDIVITNPQVSRVNMMGQDTWQVVGDVSEKPRQPFSDEDIDTVINQTGADRGEVTAALEAAHGDLAQAIMDIKEKKN